MPSKTPGKMREHAANVIGGVHVRRIEAGDHRIEARLLRRRQRAIGHRDLRVGERVVIERRVGLQVIPGREVARVRVHPLLLQRNAEERRATDLVAHHAQKVVNVGPLLDVVRQVNVRVVEERRGGCCAPAEAVHEQHKATRAATTNASVFMWHLRRRCSRRARRSGPFRRRRNSRTFRRRPSGSRR